MIINQIENAKSLGEILRYIEKEIVIDLTAIQLYMIDIRICPNESSQEGLIDLRKIMFKNFNSRMETRLSKKKL